MTLALTLASGAALLRQHFYGHEIDPVLQLYFMFFCGASLYCLRQFIVLSHRQFGGCLLVLLLSSLNREVFFVVYLLTLGWLLCYLAYISLPVRFGTITGSAIIPTACIFMPFRCNKALPPCCPGLACGR